MPSKGFSLTEVVIAIVLVSLVMLTLVSVDITSRRYFKSSSEQTEVFDEAKIAMEHIIKNVQSGVGDMSNSRNMGDDPYDATGCSRGLYILDINGRLTDSGSRIQVKLDDDGNGLADRTIEYAYQGSPAYKIVFDRNIFTSKPTEDFADGKVVSVTFDFGKDSDDNDIPNQLDIEIIARQDPSEDEGPENPEITLTSSVILRAMSCK